MLIDCLPDMINVSFLVYHLLGFSITGREKMMMYETPGNCRGMGGKIFVVSFNVTLRVVRN